ncbi:DUF4885 family protein [Bacillus solimangrovi]|uniref:DUF4885 domain-containing protein n=1 Tax=Bacillus solimangrovi TaxID=1305675 RepID=A0A1E5LJY9_9BACI|nr:DUF4885 family protein [Bacillus solimangrovi]OEH94394.1 hypothetical protein BFG57_07995 [Bacillus solimangrovi]
MNINSITTPLNNMNLNNQNSHEKFKNTDTHNTTTIQSRNEFLSESDTRKQILDEKYRKIHKQNMMFKNPKAHIFDKYYDRHSPYYKHDLTDAEREAAKTMELGMIRNNGKKCGGYDFRDAAFREIQPINGEVEVAENKAFNRQQVNKQLQDLFEKYQISIPNDAKLTFTIDPYNYNLSVSGTEDNELIDQLEYALNIDKNAKELFLHIMRSSSHNSTQFTQEKEDKYFLAREIKNVTGYDLNNLTNINRKFITEDGQDIYELYKSQLKNNPYASVRLQHYVPHLNKLAMNGFDSVPDLVLMIGYESGSLQDIGQGESFGTGKTGWIEELQATIRY